MRFVTTSFGGKSNLYMLRGDSEGTVTIWPVPESCPVNAPHEPGKPPSTIHYI